MKNNWINRIIKVVFDAKEHSHFNKTTSVFYNGKEYFHSFKSS